MLLVPSFGNFFVYTSFKLNQEEISKTICVQRKQVFNNCNGRCELQKSLKKYADNEKKMDNNLKEKSEIVYIQNTITAQYNLIAPIESKTQNFCCFRRKTNFGFKCCFSPTFPILYNFLNQISFF